MMICISYTLEECGIQGYHTSECGITCLSPTKHVHLY